jgi:hypothetical protein
VPSKSLREDDPALYRAYQEALHRADSELGFLHGSGRYPLCGRGDTNTYAVFAETFRMLASPTGRVGMVIPTGIATDATTSASSTTFWSEGALVALYDFRTGGLFPGCRPQEQVLPPDSHRPSTPLSAGSSRFCVTDTSDLADPERRFTLSPEDFRLLNPNTRTAPIFRSVRDAELTRHIYRRVPVLVEEGKGEAGNPWGVEFLAMFHMANDSHLFRRREELEAEGFRLEGNVFVRGAERYLPLYEAKMIDQFDHRAAD